MRRSHLIIFSCIALAALAGAFLKFAPTWQPDLELPAYTYTQNQDWAAIPDSPTQPVWRTGWQTDVLLFLDQNAIGGKSQKQVDQHTVKARDTSQLYTSALSAYGEVYAPLLRTDNAQDAQAALTTYLTDYNRGRAFIIATDDTHSLDFTDIIKSENAEERFGGYYGLNTDKPARPLIDNRQSCPEHMSQGCKDFINLVIDKSSVSVRNDTIDSASGLFQNFQTYLKNDIRPMAEPLGDFEEVEIITTKKPSESFNNRD